MHDKGDPGHGAATRHGDNAQLGHELSENIRDSRRQHRHDQPGKSLPFVRGGRIRRDHRKTGGAK